jgi:hypothetical protein
MRLPFTADEFFDVFGAYNLLFWPAAFALWVLSASMGSTLSVHAIFT